MYGEELTKKLSKAEEEMENYFNRYDNKEIEVKWEIAKRLNVKEDEIVIDSQTVYAKDKVYKISYNKDIELEAMIDITKGED